MAISRASFARNLRSNYVPHWAFPRIEPIEVFDYYKLGIIRAKRKIASSNKEYERVYINESAQKEIWNKLVDDESPLDSYVIGVSSCVNDYLAHEFTALLHLAMLRSHDNPEWKWVNTMFDPSKQSRDSISAPKIVVIRGVVPEKERIYRIRDILDYFNFALRIVIVGGVNAVEYFDQFLRHPLNGAFHVEGYKKMMPSEVSIDSSSEFVETRYPAFILGDDASELISSIRRK